MSQIDCAKYRLTVICVVGVVPPEVWGVCCVARVVGVGAAWMIIWGVAVSVVGVAVVTAIGVSVATANPLTPIVVITVTLRHHRM